ncbi:UDP-glucose--hexose-1-phosphate uridylyltransferase [Puniceicoccales bacterium CK1056]|uniref:Galactose-1-phosphate uridylyltransferase n=1 Tax=Oceanipulchritudo coccoides TaxID=2706888 RepID=A0A6B2M106_9BACT|nr:UDP-glucose--hexose-1-phosphate uridylyltransferase [Oceanipulchritudo coccoides]NDV61465.1 UDP-glucose--hexose-1-phosphate uridylyltransferase [Oceanipulchritudo coccoides]
MDKELLPHRRRNQLTGEWVLCSPHRATRPWLGQQEEVHKEERPEHDPSCYLCPGNRRANGVDNPSYEGTYVFENDFPALLNEDPSDDASEHHLLRCANVQGTCRVICFSPRHDLTLAKMEPADICRVIQTWKEQTAELGQKYKWVQVFENKGAIMGCSNPHPHGQVWAMDAIPTLPLQEDARQREYFGNHHDRLLLNYVELEIERKERMICQNDDWAVVVPYWATWPFETLLLPRFKISRMTELTTNKAESLAVVMKELLQRYDGLFSCDFPYSMGWHGAPFNGSAGEHWQLHAHFYPPLLRSATVKKFMVGFEMMAEPQRDITPETAADRLREVKL